MSVPSRTGIKLSSVLVAQNTHRSPYALIIPLGLRDIVCVASRGLETGEASPLIPPGETARMGDATDPKTSFEVLAAPATR